MATRSHNAPNARDGNKTVAQLVDESIDLWSKMVKDEEENAGREGVRLFGIWRIPFISRGVQVQKKDCKFSGLVR